MVTGWAGIKPPSHDCLFFCFKISITLMFQLGLLDFIFSFQQFLLFYTEDNNPAYTAIKCLTHDLSSPCAVSTDEYHHKFSRLAVS